MDAMTLKSKMQTYKIWAPDNALWTEWAKPVLFASVPEGVSFSDAPDLDVPQINWLTARNRNTMIVVDLPGKSGVEEGLALARLGYRPVPLYNGVFESMYLMLVNVSVTVAALYNGADILQTLTIKADAPPAFLLDYDRMSGGGKQPRKYDNRWCIFPQDMPSAGFLLKHRISEVIVRAERIKEDLSHILLRYQEQKIKISLCDGSVTNEINVSKPSRFKSLLYRFMVILGLTRNAAGGFGGHIPEPSSGGG